MDINAIAVSLSGTVEQMSRWGSGIKQKRQIFRNANTLQVLETAKFFGVVDVP